MNTVYIVGSINMDIVASVSDHPKVGETVFGTDLAYFPGGKGANQAVAAARSGAQTVMIGAVGKDTFGSKLMDFLRENSIDTQFIATHETLTTGTALITVANAQNTIVVVPGANDAVVAAQIPIPKSGDIVVAQCETPLKETQKIFTAAQAAGVMTVLNPAPYKRLSEEMIAVCDIIIVNQIEINNLLQSYNMPVFEKDNAQLSDFATRLDVTIVVTLGSNGVIAATGNGDTYAIAGKKVEAVDSTGAGDCFVGNLCAKLLESNKLDEALEYANAAAALSVTISGAGPSMPYEKDVLTAK